MMHPEAPFCILCIVLSMIVAVGYRRPAFWLMAFGFLMLLAPSLLLFVSLSSRLPGSPEYWFGLSQKLGAAGYVLFAIFISLSFLRGKRGVKPCDAANAFPYRVHIFDD